MRYSTKKISDHSLKILLPHRIFLRKCLTQLHFHKSYWSQISPSSHIHPFFEHFTTLRHTFSCCIFFSSRLCTFCNSPPNHHPHKYSPLSGFVFDVGRGMQTRSMSCDTNRKNKRKEEYLCCRDECDATAFSLIFLSHFIDSTHPIVKPPLCSFRFPPFMLSFPFSAFFSQAFFSQHRVGK